MEKNEIDILEQLVILDNGGSAPEVTAGIIPIPCTSRKEETDTTVATVVIVENFPKQKKLPKINRQATESESCNNKWVFLLEF